MPWAAAAIFGSAVVGGIFSSSSSSKAAKLQAASADAATAASLEMHRDTMARNDGYVMEAEVEFINQKIAIQNLYYKTQEELQRAYQQQDQMAIESLQKNLAGLESKYNDISSQIETGQADTNRLLDSGDQAIYGNYEENSARIAEAQGQVDQSAKTMGNNNAAVGEELQRVQALGSKPEGYDAAKSDLEAGFRDAEANIRRQNGGQISEAEKLNLEMNKAKGLGGQSATMRSGWAQQRSNMIGNLAGQSNAGEMNILNAQAGVRNEATQNSNAYLGNQLNQNTNRINTGQSFLDKKLSNKEQYANSKIAANSVYDTTRAGNAQNFSTNKISNDANRLALNNAAYGNLQGTKLGAMGVTSNANSNMSNIYGNIAQTNIAGAGASANAATQAIASIPSNAVAMYGAYNNFKTPTTTPTVTPAPTTPTTNTPIWT
jgi:hypothetical protein